MTHFKGAAARSGRTYEGQAGQEGSPRCLPSGKEAAGEGREGKHGIMGERKIRDKAGEA